MELPLYFLPPRCWQHTQQQLYQLPPDAAYTLPYASPKLLCWGPHGENYVLQQSYTTAGITLVLFSSCLARHSLLTVQSPQPYIGMQYTLVGRTFVRLQGFGCLRLQEHSYSPLYVPQGTHLQLLPKGLYHNFYMIPGPGFEALTRHHTRLAHLFTGMEAGLHGGLVATRMPIIATVAQQLQQLQGLQKEQRSFDFSIMRSILSLLECYECQLDQKGQNPSLNELPGHICTFIANHLEQPVPELLQQLKRRFYIEGKPLLAQWKKISTLPLRRYINEARMELALYYLTAEVLPVRETAHLLGYKDYSSFTEQFTGRFGYSPSRALLKVDR